MASLITHGQLAMISPPLKWAGGKRRLLPQLLEAAPKEFDRYYEPMIGGGALFFALEPKKAFISDLNADLMMFYHALRSDPKGVLDLATEVMEMPYYALRDQFNEWREEWSPIEQAAVFLNLNRRCFNGLWRVNKSGDYNVPKGTSSALPSLEDLESASALLSKATIQCESYQSVFQDAGKGDFVYLDPPYHGTFDGYTKGGWDDHDHSNMFHRAAEAVKRGVYVLISQNDTPLVNELVSHHGFSSTVINAPQNIAADGAKRTPRRELLIRGGY